MLFEKSLYNNILSNLYIASFLLAGDRHYDKSSVGTNGFTHSLRFCRPVNFPTLPVFSERRFPMQSRRHHTNHGIRCYLLRWLLFCCVSSYSETADELLKTVLLYVISGVASLLSWLSKKEKKNGENAA